MAQRIGDEPLRRASHYARERRAERAAARRVLEMRRHDGAAATGCVAEAERAEMRELLATQPPPRKLLVGDVARDVHLGVGERRQVLRPREVGIDLGSRARDGDRFLHDDGLGELRLRRLAVHADAERLQHRVAACVRLVEEPAAHARRQRP
ncbi:MAG: hypothetical protein E6H54_16875 [Betaproteobacteria bacterium]|nr:MAG: hypothetical protein E6H54_16875 [Betaproteobacteria bacterium]